MGRAGSVLAFAVASAAAGSLIALARVPARGPSRAEIDQVAAELDAQLREAAASTRSRAQTLADLPRLALAVATDAPTVRDLTGEELAFRPRTGETIEIAQVPRAGGAPASLLRIPPDPAVAVPLESPGVHLVMAGASLRVAAVVRVEPRARADELYGVVAVTRPPDLDPVSALLEPLGAGVRLETPAGSFAIGPPLPPGADTVAIALGAASRGARLVAPAPGEPGWSAAPLILGIAMAVLGLVTSVLLWRRRGPASARDPSQPLPLVTQVTPMMARPDLTGGFRLGQYMVLRRLGSGGMADIYLARSEGEAGFERLVALKVIQDEMASNPKFVSHFLDEARLVSILNHPNIVAITDLGKADDKYVIAMEFVDGADLERLIHSVAARRALVPVRVALAIVRRICEGLHFAHSALDGQGQPLHLVHRDVKSANVFVSRSGAVKVGDFGIAKIASSMRTARTEIGEVKGTAAYMAPEHRIGGEVDRRADLYAVGAICYELLTGQVINLDLAMLAHLGREGWPHLAPPSGVRPELPRELDGVVFRAMAFEREDRFASCEELELALAAIVERYALSANDRAIAQWIAEELTHLPGQTQVAGPGRAASEPA
ncbi:MAG TPA: protein kinase [Kofleriaceae bacterium]|nr:protein kinase [Kofleriaceae bacterium]